MVSGNHTRIIRFGRFEADLETGELRKDGVKLALQVQPFQVLAILLKNPGGLVTREQFQSQVWPKDTFVDFDHALNTAITKIRLALGDDAEHPTYIETLPRRGYRFIADVETPRTEAPAPEVAGAAGRRTKSRWLWALAGAAAAGLLLTLVAWRLTRNPLQSPSASIEVVPLVALHGSQASPAFSPDGNQVAFAEYEGRDAAIYTALVGGDKPLQLTVKSDVCCPTWSPDNRQIAFMRFLKDRFSINVVSALGGAEKTLYTAKLASGVRGGCDHLDWSPDGKWLAFGEPRTSGLDPRIALISLGDLSVRPLTSPVAQEYDCQPAFSPDGSRVAFERGSLGGLGKDLFVIPFSGGEPHRLTFDNSWGGSPAWTQDGSEILFSSNRGGPLNLWRVSTMGGVPRPVAGVSALAWQPSISRKGNLMAYEHATFDTGIWRIILKDKTHSSGHSTPAITARGMINARPNFSPDGKKVVFESDRLGFSDIWYCNSDGSNCAQLTSLHGTAGTARWSPDGRHIAFEFQSQHYYDVYVLDVADGRPRQLITFPNADNGAPNWSRDGKWIYFYSSQEKGPLQLWKVPFQGGTPVRVTKNGGVYATESEDGRFLYYSKFGQPGIWKMSLTGGEEEHVVDQPDGFLWFNWALAPGGIYFLNQADSEKPSIEFFDFASRKRTLIDVVEKPRYGLALAPDGKSLLYGRIDSEDYQIMLVKNFH
jgi:Tol biopolymer transport system component/DNA-binding winged helix-turn-helix (wHTH) protein